MHFPRALATLTLAFGAVAKADFQIYKTESVDVVGSERSRWMVFDGPPSCDDVGNKYRVLANSADVSKTPGVRCKGCKDDDITELEINSGTDWGHHTIYKDAGWELEPKDGGANRGSCTADTGDDFTCTGATTTTGTRQFICSSDLEGIRAK